MLTVWPKIWHACGDLLSYSDMSENLEVLESCPCLRHLGNSEVHSPHQFRVPNRINSQVLRAATGLKVPALDYFSLLPTFTQTLLPFLGVIS